MNVKTREDQVNADTLQILRSSKVGISSHDSICVGTCSSLLIVVVEPVESVVMKIDVVVVVVPEAMVEQMIVSCGGIATMVALMNWPDVRHVAIGPVGEYVYVVVELLVSEQPKQGGIISVKYDVG